METLKILREQKNLTQEELSKAIEIKRQSISRYEIGIVEPNIETLKKLANYFDVSVDYLIGHRQNNKIDMSGLTETQKNIIRMTYELNEIDAARVESYISAKLESENERNFYKKFN